MGRAASKDDYTPMHKAADEGDLEAFRKAFTDEKRKTMLGRKQLYAFAKADGSPLPGKAYLTEKEATEIVFRDSLSPWQNTTLATAAGEGRLNIMREIIDELGMHPDDNGAPQPRLNQRAGTHVGTSALYTASCGGHLAAVQLLLDRGADPNRGATNNGDLAVHVAAAQGHLDVVMELIRRGAHPFATGGICDGNALLSACFSGRHEVVAHLLSLDGADAAVNRFNAPNKPGHSSRAPLHHAAEQGHPATVRVLLQRSDTIDIRGGPYRCTRTGRMLRLSFLPGTARELAEARVGDLEKDQEEYRERQGNEAPIPPENVRLLQGCKEAITLLELAVRPFEPADQAANELRPPRWKASARALLLVNLRRGTAAGGGATLSPPLLPKELWLRILGFCGRRWFVPTAEAVDAADGGGGGGGGGEEKGQAEEVEGDGIRKAQGALAMGVASLNEDLRRMTTQMAALTHMYDCGGGGGGGGGGGVDD